MAGAEFPESVKKEARRLAIYRCCYCRDSMGDHVHHLLPQVEGGLGTLDNAVLLCVRCHDLYGHRADKRAQLRQARDDWHQFVAAKYSTTAVDNLENIATKQDVGELAAVIHDIYEIVLGNLQSGKMTRADAVNVASSMASSMVQPSPFYGLHVTDTPLPLRVTIPSPKVDEST